MAASAPHNFKGVTPAQFARLTEKARGAGIEMTGEQGTASKFGVEVSWHYSPATQELTLQCISAPFFMSTSDVNARISSMVKESLASA